MAFDNPLNDDYHPGTGGPRKIQGPHSVSGRTSYRKISRSL